MDVIHQYFKKETDDFIILVRVNPVDYTGLELLIGPGGEIKKTVRTFDEDIFEDLAVDQFKEVGALEFNLYLKNLVR